MARPLPDWVLDEMTDICYVCAEVKAGLNQREEARMHFRMDSERVPGVVQPLRRLGECGLCARVICDHHANHRECIECHTLRYRFSGFAIGCDHHANYRLCIECHTLHFRFSGFAMDGVSVARGKSFRRRWLLFRWRATKRRLVERLRISRVVERQLPKDVANLVATYAVK